MKKGNFIFQLRLRGLIAIAAGAAIMASCARDGYDEETFSSSVTNSQLSSPIDTDITITPSADGTKQTITWSVVEGAGGYLVSLVEQGTPDVTVINDSIVDGCSVTCARSEDANYTLKITTLGNNKYSNTGAAEATTVTYNTFTPTYRSIPTGTDLYEYFQENPLPEDTTGALNFDLEESGTYTLSGILDFNDPDIYVTLRTANKNLKANVTVLPDAGFRCGSPFTLKYLIVDMDQTLEPVIGLSKEPADTLKNLLGGNGGSYIITGDPVAVKGCEFYNVHGNFLFDNNTKWCIETFLMDNCIVQTDVNAELKAQAYFYFKQGFVKDFYVQNSSWYNTGEENFKYFMQYSNAGRLDRAGYQTAEGQSVNFQYNSFYKIGSNTSQWANYSAFVGRNYTWFNVIGNIWQDCMPNIAKRILGQRLPSTYDVCNFDLNTYWKDGAMATDWQNESGNFDNGTVLTTDPAFVNPDLGDLTPTGAEQVAYQTGDPRWFE